MLRWLNDQKFSIDDINFTIDINPGPNRRISKDNDFTIVKTKSYISFYELMEKKFEYILELGLFQGGSLVFLDKLFKPNKLVGIDISSKKIDPLEKYINNGAGHIKTYYNSSQDDEKLLNDIVRKHFNGKLDLVVDDASHQYDLTKKSFSTLFPMLNAGGTYIIEDWAWSHRDNAQRAEHPWYKKPALTNLLFEIVVELGSNSEIDDIYINNNLIRIKKAINGTFRPVLENNKLRGRNSTLI